MLRRLGFRPALPDPSYRVELTSGHAPETLIGNLQKGYPTSVHISQEVSARGPDWLAASIGGLPHTVTLAGCDPAADTWKMLDPGRDSGFTTWNTGQLMELWGRRFLGYPPRFSMTTLIPDAR